MFTKTKNNSEESKTYLVIRIMKLYDESTLTPIPVQNGQTKRLGELAHVNVTIDRPAASQKASSSSVEEGLLLKKGEQFQVKFQMEKSLTAPVSAGTQVGTIKYFAGKDLYKVESILTCDDIPAISYFWCLHQSFLRYYLH